MEINRIDKLVEKEKIDAKREKNERLKEDREHERLKRKEQRILNIII